MDKGFETIDVLERNRQPFTPKVNPISRRDVEYSLETETDGGPAGTIVFEIPKSKLTNYKDNSRLGF